MKNFYFCTMFFRTIRLILPIFLVFALASCSSYKRVLKSTDVEFKFKKAEEYFKAKKYGLVIPLMEDLIPSLRGTAKSEWVYYYYAMSHYHLDDYISASVYLKNFVKTFPKSELAEECSFLGAVCTYLQSPKYSLDQTETKNAITDFQLFLNRYPESNKRDTVNTLMIKCSEKLEQKAFEISKLYFKTEKYKSAVVAFDNTLKDFPNTRYEEEILLMTLRANYELAMRSIEEKKRERLENTVKSYQRYIDKYSQSKNTKDAEAIYKTTLQELEKISKS